MKYKYIFVILVLIFSLSACATSQVEPEELPAPPTPEAGMATVTGRVVSEITNEPLGGATIRLAEVVRAESEDGEGDVFVLDQAFSPGVYADDKGIFVVANVDAMEYVIVIGDVESIYEIVIDESGKPKVWNALPDTVLNVGDLIVSLTQEDV